VSKMLTKLIASMNSRASGRDRDGALAYAPITDGGSVGAYTNSVVNGPAATSATGGNETRPKNVNVLYCIRY